MRVSRSSLKQIVGATILLVAAGVIFLPAYMLWNASIQHRVQTLAQCGTAPDFEETDQAGRAIGTTQLRGHIWVVDLIRSTEQREGELRSAKFFELDQNFQKSKALALISFCIGDTTSDEIAKYARSHEASARWHFIRATAPDTSASSQDSSLLDRWTAAVARCAGKPPLESCFVLVDQEGTIRNVYDANAPEVVQQILIDVGSLLHAGASPGSAP